MLIDQLVIRLCMERLTSKCCPVPERVPGIQGDRGPGCCDCFVGISQNRINLMDMGDLKLSTYLENS